MQLDHGLRVDLIQLRAPGERAAVPVKQDTSRRQDVRVVGIGQFVRLQVFQTVEGAAPLGERIGKKKRRAGVVRCGARPVHAVLPFEARVVDPLERWCQHCHFVPDLSRIGVIEAGILAKRHAGQRGRCGDRLRRGPVSGLATHGCQGCAQSPGQLAGDLPVGHGLAKGRDGGAHALHPPVGVGKGAILLGETGRRQQHVGIGARLVEEDILAHDK